MTPLRIVALVAWGLALASALCRLLAWLYTPEGGDVWPVSLDKAGHYAFMARGSYAMAVMVGAFACFMVALGATR